jgi:integrase
MKAKTTVQQHLEHYLIERRRLGFTLRGPEARLRNFACYADRSQQPLTVELMAQWARRGCTKANPAAWARRLDLLRPFIRYLQQFEPLTEVPDDHVFGPTPRRVTPHIFHEREIAQLLAAAHELMPRLRAATFETLFGLLACAGLRVSEALHLLDRDVDLKQGLLTIRQAKFAKSRQVPLHPSTVAALQSYRRTRAHYVAPTPEIPFFVTAKGKRFGQPLQLTSVDLVFAALRKRLGWRNRGAHHAPRVYDLRHTFAVRRVMLWHEHGTDIDQAMLALSTYLGHARISDTYWYLTAVPELMALAAGKFECFAHGQGAHHD